MFKLIPTDEKFFEMFEKSAVLFHQATQLLSELSVDVTKLPGLASRIERLEHDADGITHEVLVRLDKSFITPIDREDIHRLALALDDCMDTMEAAVDHMVLYRIQALPAVVKELATCLEAQAAQIVQLMGNLKGLKWEAIKPFCIEINRLENEADRLTRTALGDLFDGSREPLDVIKWRDIFELLEDASDKCEDVAGVVEAIVLKNS